MDGRSKRKKNIPLRHCVICGELIPRNTKQGEKRISPAQYIKTRFCSRKCKGVEHSKNLKGKNNPNYKDGKNIVRELSRQCKEYKQWRKEIFERDKYTCQSCGIVGSDLNAHHLKSWKDNEKLRFNLNNGTTLCVECHTIIHNIKEDELQ